MKQCRRIWIHFRDDSRFPPGQWEKSLSNHVSHWLGANLESALELVNKPTGPNKAQMVCLIFAVPILYTTACHQHCYKQWTQVNTIDITISLLTNFKIPVWSQLLWIMIQIHAMDMSQCTHKIKATKSRSSARSKSALGYTGLFQNWLCCTIKYFL